MRWLPLALGLAAAGQYLFAAPARPYLALALYVLAGYALGLAVPLAEVTAAPSPGSVARRRWLALLPFVVAIPVLGCLAVVRRDATLSWAWLLAMVGLVIAAVAVDGMPRATVRRLARWRPSPAWLIGAALLVICLFLRTWQYDAVPPAPMLDDGELGVRARRLVEGRPAIPFESAAWRNTEMHSFVIAGFMALPVDPLLGLTLAGAVPAVVAIAAAAALARAAYGVPVALATIALLGFNRWFVLISRIGSDFALSVMLGVVAVFCAWQAMRSGRAVWWVATGMVCGIALVYLYVAVIAPLLVAVLWLLLRRRSHPSVAAFADGAVCLGLAGAVALAVWVPRILVLIREPPTIAYYATFASIGGSTSGGPPWPQHLVDTALGLVYRSFGRLPYMFEDRPGPLLDPISAGLAMLGFGYLLRRAFCGGAWSALWVAFGLLAMLIAGSSRGSEASNYRIVMLLPTAAVGGALALVALASLPARLAARWRAARVRASTGSGRHDVRLGDAHLGPLSAPEGAGLVLPASAGAGPGTPAVARPASAHAAGSSAVLALPIAAVALGVLSFTYRDYFLGLPARETVWRSSYANALAAGRWIAARAPLIRTTFILATPDIGISSPFQLEAPLGLVGNPRRYAVEGDDAAMPPPLPLGDEVERLWVLDSAPPWTGANALWLGRAAEAYYPGAVATRLLAPDGRWVGTIYQIDRAAIEARRALMPSDTPCQGSRDAAGVVSSSWRGRVFIREPGRYTIDTVERRGCVNVGLRREDVRGRPVYLPRGWQAIVVGAPSAVQPSLTLARGDRPAEAVAGWQLDGGSPAAAGFQATFADRADAEPYDRRDLVTFDREWAKNPPSEGTTFFVELRATIDLPRSTDYIVQLVTHGLATFDVDGARLVTTPATAGATTQVRAALAAGRHAIVLRYGARSLGPTGARLFPADREASRLDTYVVSNRP